MNQGEQEDENNNLEVLKRTRFLTIKAWEEHRLQASQFYKNIAISINKKIQGRVEQSNELVHNLMKYFKEKGQSYNKFANPYTITIQETALSPIVNAILDADKQFQSQMKSMGTTLESMVPKLEEDLQTLTVGYNAHKSQYNKRVSTVETLTNKLNSNYKDYGKVYLESQKLSVKGKEIEKDLYSSELPYLFSSMELHFELKQFGKETFEFAEQVIKHEQQRQELIINILQQYCQQALEFKQSQEWQLVISVIAEFKKEVLGANQIVSQQDANYLKQQLKVGEQEELTMETIRQYLFGYELVEPTPNQLVLMKHEGQYEKGKNNIKTIAIVVTVDRFVIIHSKKPIHTLQMQYVAASIEDQQLLLVECKKGLLGNSKKKVVLLSAHANELLEYDHLMDLPDDIGFQKDEVVKVDLFSLKNFELPRFPRSEQIKQMAVSEHMFLIITRANNVYRWRPQIEDECQPMELPELHQAGVGSRLLQAAMIGSSKKDKKDLVLEKVFVSGHHGIICSDSGENFYIKTSDNKVRLLESIRGRLIKCIGWNEVSEEHDTNEILIATKDSKIMLYRIDFRQGDFRDCEPKVMVTIPNERQINQIEQLTLTLDNSRYACVVVSTNFSIFFFYGANSLEILFSKYKDPQNVMRAESQPTRSHTSLLSLCYSKPPNGRAHSFLYTNGKQLNLYELPERDLNESLLTSYKQLLNTQSGYDVPIQIGLTEFHYLILSTDALTIISRITQEVVQKYELRQMGRILGMQYDRENDVFWVYSEKSLCKIDGANEDKDAWKLLMDKKLYMEAYKIGKKYNSPYTEYIAGLCGDSLFTQRKYTDASIYYLQSSKSFEEIFLKYLSCDDMKARIGLEHYLKELTNNLKKEQERTLVLSWRCELLVYRLNEMEKLFQENKHYDSEVSRQKDQREKQQNLKDLKQDIDEFLKQYQKELPEELVYQIMQSHGRIENCVEFAKLNNNYEMIILHHINEENYKEAIRNLKNVKDKNSMEVIQKYSHILMKFEPEATLQLFNNHIKKFDPTKIIGGLMNIPIEKRNFGIQFIEHSINKLNCTEKSINNLLIFFLTQPPQKEKLNEYLALQEVQLIEREKVNFELDFALRLFQGASLIDPCITIYGMMGLFTEAVQLALDYNLIDKAKAYASKPLDDDKKKKLWMLIAERLLKQNEAIDKVIDLTKDTDLIKIEDLLPHFNENIKIEHFKDEICNSLKMYNEEIEKLKEEMKKLSSNSDQLKNELKMTKNKFLIIDTQQKCEHCTKHLFNDTFYIFPCNHGFHKDCIVFQIKQQPQNAPKIQKIDTLDMKMQSIIQKSNPQQLTQSNKKQQDGSSFFQLMNIFGATKQEQRPQSILTPEEERMLKETKEEFDLLVASECIFCGPSVVDSIQIGFEIDSKDKETWSL